MPAATRILAAVAIQSACFPFESSEKDEADAAFAKLQNQIADQCRLVVAGGGSCVHASAAELLVGMLALLPGLDRLVQGHRPCPPCHSQTFPCLPRGL